MGTVGFTCVTLLIVLTNYVKRHRTNVTLDMKQDIMWWLNFMEIFNGTMPMVDCHPVSFPVCIDAC